LDAFYRWLRLKEFFYHSDHSEEEEYHPNPFRSNKKEVDPPKNREPALETYIQAVKVNVWRKPYQKEMKRQPHNTREGALNNVTKRTQAGEIVIKPADKGSANVIMSREDYVTKAMRQLNKEEHYCQMDQTPHLTAHHPVLRTINLLMKRPITSLHHSMREQQFSTCYPRFTNEVTLPANRVLVWDAN